MAEVPELNDVPMDNSENDIGFYDNDVPIKMKANKHSHCYESRMTCLSQIKSEIRKPKKSAHLFKKVIKLAAVIKEFKGQGFNDQSFFHDDDLLIPVLENDNITYNTVEIEEALKTRFLYSKTSEHAIRDSKLRSLRMEGDDSIVVSFLAGENAQLELKINVSTYLEGNIDADKRPVTLGIVGRKLYLCCTAEGIANQMPSLTEVDDIKAKKDDDLLPFIFYYRKDGRQYTFESAAFHGYYLSTSQNEDEKLQMKPEQDQVFLRHFGLTPRLGWDVATTLKPK